MWRFMKIRNWQTQTILCWWLVRKVLDFFFLCAIYYCSLMDIREIMSWFCHLLTLIVTGACRQYSNRLFILKQCYWQVYCLALITYPALLLQGLCGFNTFQVEKAAAFHLMGDRITCLESFVTLFRLILWSASLFGLSVGLSDWKLGQKQSIIQSSSFTKQWGKSLRLYRHVGHWWEMNADAVNLSVLPTTGS